MLQWKAVRLFDSLVTVCCSIFLDTKRIYGMRKKEPKLIITFHTTAEAIAMEKLCKENQKSGRMIPVPREISAGCGLAWCCEPDMEQEMAEFMKEKGMEHEEMVRLMY